MRDIGDLSSGKCCSEPPSTTSAGASDIRKIQHQVSEVQSPYPAIPHSLIPYCTLKINSIDGTDWPRFQVRQMEMVLFGLGVPDAN